MFMVGKSLEASNISLMKSIVSNESDESIESTSSNRNSAHECLEGNADDQRGEQEKEERSHVMIPAFKATPTSIIRQSTTTTTAATATGASPISAGRNADYSSSSSALPPPPPPHVPHEPYKGAVWSKPVRVSGSGRRRGTSASASASSTPRSSKPPSRTASRSGFGEGHRPELSCLHGHDITSPSLSTVSILSPPPLSSEAKPVSVVNPVKSPGSSSSSSSSLLANSNIRDTSSLSSLVNSERGAAADDEAVVDAATGSHHAEAAPSSTNSVVGEDEEAFQGSTTEALRVEILRLREENRRLHAMRRSSCDDAGAARRRRRSEGVDAEASFATSTSLRRQQLCSGDEAPSSTPEEELRAENESLKEKAKKLASQLQMQAQVNRDLKKLVIASIGDDLQYRFETIASSRAQLDQEACYLLKSLGETKEELEKASIECDVWKSKFMASRVMVDGLAESKAALQLKHAEMERALNLFIEENESLHSVASATNRNLNQLSASLRRRYPQLGDDKPEEPSVEEVVAGKSPSDLPTAKRNLVEITKENRRIAQSLNFEIGALIKVAEDRSLFAAFPAVAAPSPKGTNSNNNSNKSPSSSSSSSSTGESQAGVKSTVVPTPASTVARQLLQSETSPPPQLSNDAIAYLDILFGAQGQPPQFTFKCCENCNGDIKTL